jgi:transposase
MSQNFVACDREQVLLLPPNLREWLPEDHLAWFVLAAAEEMDLSAFYASYRSDGHGRAAHEPAMMVALLLYAYCKGAALLACDRARVRRGCRVPCDRG